MIIKHLLRAQLKHQHKLKYRIKEKPRSRDIVNKELFLDTLKTLKEINERTEFSVVEIGIDPTAYEEKFFDVIENLMKIAFNKQQVSLITMYLNEIPYTSEDEWDGTITIKVGTVQHTIAFKTPEDVWNAIQKFK